MKRRTLLLGTAFALRADEVLRGKLGKGRRVATVGSSMEVSGDESVEAVLDDERVIGMEIEVEGSRDGAGKFAANAIHTKPVWTRVNGKRMIVAYWCDVCYIRFYKPGTCWCCQKDVLLDLKDPDTPERVP
jgi:hypothetical protein